MDTQVAREIVNMFEKNNPKKHYLNFKEIEYIWHGAWADSELVYKGKHVDYWDIEDYLYDIYKDEMLELGYDFNAYGDCTGMDYEEWCLNNEEYCYERLDEIINDLQEYGKRG